MAYNIPMPKFGLSMEEGTIASWLVKEGDTVVILHYNEETSEWEYITTDTVEDGKVGGDTIYTDAMYKEIYAYVYIKADGLKVGEKYDFSYYYQEDYIILQKEPSKNIL